MATEPHALASSGHRITALVLALLNLGGALLVAFFGLLADGLRCDDNCSIAPGWRNDPNAWQWHGIVVLALVILGSAVVLSAAAMIRRARNLRTVAVAVQLVAVLFLTVISLTASDTHGGWDYLVLLLFFFGVTGVGSAWSAPR